MHKGSRQGFHYRDDFEVALSLLASYQSMDREQGLQIQNGPSTVPRFFMAADEQAEFTPCQLFLDVWSIALAACRHKKSLIIYMMAARLLCLLCFAFMHACNCACP